MVEKDNGVERVKRGQACLCGCGGMTRGGRFRQGHDGRLFGLLTGRLHVDPHDREAREALARLGWLGRFKPRKSRRTSDSAAVLEEERA